MSPWVGIGIAIFSGMVGAAVRVFDFTPKQKQVVGWLCVGGAGVGLLIAAYGFGAGVGGGLQEAGVPTVITQTSPHGSPNVMGDGNQFTYNQGGGNASAVLGYARVDEHGVISAMENFREYGMRVKRNDFEKRSVHSVGQTEYILTFDKVPEPLDVRTQDGSSPKVDPILNRSNERRVRCMAAGFGGEFARKCGFTVWALK